MMKTGMEMEMEMETVTVMITRKNLLHLSKSAQTALNSSN